MIIDFHTHIGTSLFGYKQTPDDLLLLLKELNIDGAVICPIKPFSYDFIDANDYISEVCKEYPDKFIGFARIDPWQKDAGVNELKRCMEKLFLKGLFLNPYEEVFPINSEIVYPLIELMAQYKMPVIISGGHPRVSTAWQIADLAGKFPEVNFIATSGGQINISGAELWSAEIMLTENPNVFMETSGVYREDFIEEMVQKLGKHRVFFGSNSPVYNLRLEINRIRWAHISEQEKKAVLGENAEQLLINQ